MPYIVSGTIAGAPKPVEFRLGEVGRALTQAGILLKSGASDVSIHDERFAAHLASGLVNAGGGRESANHRFGVRRQQRRTD